MTAVDYIGITLAIVLAILMAYAYFYAFRPKNKKLFESMNDFVNKE